MILLALLTLACMAYLVYFNRNRTMQRLFVLGIFLAALSFILFPEYATRLAHLFGIGRGADLVFYLSTLFLFFIAFNFYARFGMQDEKLTALVRELALLRRKLEEIQPNPASGSEERPEIRP